MISNLSDSVKTTLLPTATAPARISRGPVLVPCARPCETARCSDGRGRSRAMPTRTALPRTRPSGAASPLLPPGPHRSPPARSHRTCTSPGKYTTWCCGDGAGPRGAGGGSNSSSLVRCGSAPGTSGSRSHGGLSRAAENPPPPPPPAGPAAQAAGAPQRLMALPRHSAAGPASPRSSAAAADRQRRLMGAPLRAPRTARAPRLRTARARPPAPGPAHRPRPPPLSGGTRQGARHVCPPRDDVTRLFKRRRREAREAGREPVRSRCPWAVPEP